MGDRASTPATERLPDGTDDVLAAVPPAGAPPATSSEIGAALGRSQGWVTLRLRALARAGLVTSRREGNGRNRWSRASGRFRRSPGG